MLGLFGVSALYHRRTWRTPRGRAVMKRLDHSMIFVFIAGTYTPLAVLAMDRPTGTLVLLVVWGGRAGRGGAEDAVAARPALGRGADLPGAGLGGGLRAARHAAPAAGWRRWCCCWSAGCSTRVGAVFYATRVAEPVARHVRLSTSSSTPRRCWRRSATTSRSGCSVWPARRPPSLRRPRASGPGPAARPPWPSPPAARRATRRRAAPTRRTAQASASERERATPESTRVSSTMPLRLPQPRHHRHRRDREQLDRVRRAGRPRRPCAGSGARPGGRSRSARPWWTPGTGRSARPPRPRSAPPASVSANSPSSAGSSPTIRISSRSTVTSGAPVNHSSGSRPAQPGRGVVGAGQVGLLPPAAAGTAAAGPVRASRDASVRTSQYLRCCGDYEITQQRRYARDVRHRRTGRSASRARRPEERVGVRPEHGHQRDQHRPDVQHPQDHDAPRSAARQRSGSPPRTHRPAARTPARPPATAGPARRAARSTPSARGCARSAARAPATPARRRWRTGPPSSEPVGGSGSASRSSASAAPAPIAVSQARSASRTGAGTGRAGTVERFMSTLLLDVADTRSGRRVQPASADSRRHRGSPGTDVGVSRQGSWGGTGAHRYVLGGAARQPHNLQ